jgi:small acid-soluble spore protein H (minor)
MNKQRAIEITNSPVMINVTYNGIPVYIQHVDEMQETARIYPIDKPQNELQVSLNSLNEE